MAWNLARVVNFCFDKNEAYSDMSFRAQHWEELCDLVQTWMRDRPASFNPIYEGPSDDEGLFPHIWFTADWHGKDLESSFLTHCLQTRQRFHFAITTLLASCSFGISHTQIRQLMMAIVHLKQK
jgi:hypothetical protein